MSSIFIITCAVATALTPSTGTDGPAASAAGGGAGAAAGVGTEVTIADETLKSQDTSQVVDRSTFLEQECRHGLTFNTL